MKTNVLYCDKRNDSRNSQSCCAFYIWNISLNTFIMKEVSYIYRVSEIYLIRNKQLHDAITKTARNNKLRFARKWLLTVWSLFSPLEQKFHEPSSSFLSFICFLPNSRERAIIDATLAPHRKSLYPTLFKSRHLTKQLKLT